jgi:hypothetical protein
MVPEQRRLLLDAVGAPLARRNVLQAVKETVAFKTPIDPLDVPFGRKLDYQEHI